MNVSVYYSCLWFCLSSGQEFIVPKCGYVCNLCCVFYLDEKRAKDLHCSGLRHHDNLQVPHLQVKSNTSNKNNKKNCCFCDIHFLVLLFRSTTRTMCVQNIRTPISTLSKIQPLTCLFKIRIWKEDNESKINRIWNIIILNIINNVSSVLLKHGNMFGLISFYI